MIEYSLKDLLEIKNGKDHKHITEGQIPIYGSGGIMRFGDEYLYDKPSILLPRKGTLSNIQFVNKPFWTVDTIYFSVVNVNKANPYYLYNYLKSLDLSNLNSGTGVPSMTFGAYYGIKVKLPSVEIQNQIAKVLSDLDAKIELNNKINAELEAMAKLIYDYWFVQFDFPDEEGKPYKSSGGKMVYNEELKREIPKGWEVFQIDHFTHIVDPHPSHRAPTEVKEGYPFAGIGDIDEYGNIDVLKARVINEDFVLKQENDYNITDSSLGYGRVGTVGKVIRLRKQPFRYALSPTMAVINPKNEKTSSFVYFTVKSNFFYKHALKRTSGTTRPAIGIMELRKIPVIAPRGTEQLLKFESTVAKSMKQIEILNKQNQKLAELRDWLLPMLMNGQVKVA